VHTFGESSTDHTQSDLNKRYALDHPTKTTYNKQTKTDNTTTHC